jgi:hypothetical protein
MRVECIGHATLILGDCRGVMSDMQVDSIVTDPVWPNCPPDTVPGSNDPLGLWETACNRMPVHKRATVVMRCDSDPRFLAAYRWHPFFRVMVLPYVMPGYLGRVLGGDEFAYWFGAPPALADGRRVVPGRGPLVQPGGRPPNGHPMSRAQAHFDWLLHWASDPGETVLDPFMGSGTTGVACARLGRRFIGIEIDPGYFDIACRRIEQAERQADLFVPRPPATPQEELL